uniref:Urease accessory protein UreH-like transmembrane domain-containing protein n=1 Tax=Globisporangium ultimum (strain ATCC 200006 / CBS 805.95 / DAOM BR144) TaxID=431595 RepID=K3X5J4_GLOUD
MNMRGMVHARMLSGEHTSLSNASLGTIIGTGILLGIVHVLTGPDHLSALAAMTTNSSWKAFSLGIRWGCGHSIGLIIMALIFFAAGRSVNLDEVGVYCNYIVGVFMIALGAWTLLHVKKKYKAQVKDAQLLHAETSSHGDVRRHSHQQRQQHQLTLAHVERVHSNGESQPLQQTPSHRIDVVVPTATPSPTTSYHLLVVDDAEDKSLRASEGTAVEHEGDDKMQKKKACCANVSFSNPTTQKVTALLVGIVHGIAGPGGILGVLPAVVMDDWVKSVSYLASFCISSIFIMGVFAALYGEVTGRLSRNSNLLEFRIGVFSASFSVVVGVAWIVLQATGQMNKVFE